MDWVTEADGGSSKQKTVHGGGGAMDLASSRQISAVWIGGWITGAQVAAVSGRISAYTAALGVPLYGAIKFSRGAFTLGGATIPANPITSSASKLRVRSQHVDQRSAR